ncbi:hypothetical protein AAVH_32897 [Aphelenchoides avenae]|nr:hypothetical protein AAVH_32897 [Aphelenchus avenae]
MTTRPDTADTITGTNAVAAPGLAHDPAVQALNAPARPLYRQEKTISEYEMRIQALNTQLRVAQTQVGTLEDQLRSAEHGRGQLEHQLYTAKQENANLTYRNAEIMNVMKALEQGVETLQKEKTARERRLKEAIHEKQEAEKALAREKEQLAVWSERNITLSNKCAALVAHNKETKEKLETAEREIDRLKPLVERLESDLRRKTEEHKYVRFSDLVPLSRFRYVTLKIAAMEAKERMWTKDKVEMERRLKDSSAPRMPRGAGALKDQVEAGPSASRSDQLKKLEALLEAMHHHHESQLTSIQRRLSSNSGMNPANIPTSNDVDLSASELTVTNGKQSDGRPTLPRSSVDLKLPSSKVRVPVNSVKSEPLAPK